MPELERISATRIIAAPDALNTLRRPMLMRVAADEAIVIGSFEESLAGDPHAIIQPETGFMGVWLSADFARSFLERACEWEPPPVTPAFAQGSVAGIPAKLWFERDRVLFLVPAPYAHDFEERIA